MIQDGLTGILNLMKIYAVDLLKLLNRDWGAGYIACIDFDYLGQFAKLSGSKSSGEKFVVNPNMPVDAVVDLDDLNVVVCNLSVVRKDNTSYSIPIMTLVRLCQMLNVPTELTATRPSERDLPTLPGLAAEPQTT